MAIKRRFHITPTLTTVIGAFVSITAALVLFVQASTSEKVVRDLGGELINVGLGALDQGFSSEIEAVEEASAFTKKTLISGSVLMDRPQEVADYLYGALSALKHVSFVIVADENGNFVQIDRGAADGVLVPQFVPVTDKTHALANLIKASASSTAPFWTEPQYLSARQHTYIAHVEPVIEGGVYQGLIIMAMSMQRLSEITDEISTNLVTMFMITPDSKDVVAHPELEQVFDRLSPVSPLISLDHVPDGFLAGLRSTELVDAAEYGIDNDHELRYG
ncbi:MAG: adenylate/guanylate cyclase domain-containing protein, partial [Roseibium sp.]|nr:adenylate/guanylate cyclase domain-containing protein [Roseibium sp.]